MYGQQTKNAAFPAPGFPVNWQRWVGLVPLAFFVVRLVDYLNWGTPAHIWWSCHVANLTLGVGMLLNNRLLIRIAVLWLVLGLPPWALDMAVTRIVWPLSLLTHLGGALFGLLVLGKVRMTRGVWPAALVWFLVLQGLTRLFTPPAPNVNMVYAIYEVAKPWFSRFWLYWLATMGVATGLLWILEVGLAWLFPLNPEAQGGEVEQSGL
jgi:hypothetical protein